MFKKLIVALGIILTLIFGASVVLFQGEIKEAAKIGVKAFIGDIVTEDELTKRLGAEIHNLANDPEYLKQLEIRPIPGPQGERGVKGNQGLIGENGDEGKRGERGERGEKGDSGDQGQRGKKGDPGTQGERGAQGEKGKTGEKGDIGAQGQRGEEGDPGAQGERGVRGERGKTGEDGDRGPRGEVGLLGSNGPQGRQGAAGPPGIAGLEIVSANTACAPNQLCSKTAECPTEKVAISGGHSFLNINDEENRRVRLLQSYPSMASWTVVSFSEDVNQLTVRVVCANVSN